MKRIKIEKNSLGDTRTATRVPTFLEVNNANTMHIADVKNMMHAIALEIEDCGAKHDFTKKYEPHRSLFYRELCAKIEGKTENFVDGEWYPMHCQTERHHLNEHCPDDVNLIDVIEMICDCVCAGMARSGNVYPVEISSEILQKAVANTVQMCIDSVDVKDVTRLLSLPNAQLTREGKTKDTTSDTISKTETVERLRGVVEITVPITDYDGGYIDGIETGISIVSTMSPAQPEERTETHGVCLDAISRQAAIDALDCINGVEEVLRSLPSAQPNRELIDDYMWKIKQNISPHTAADGVIAIKYYLEQIYEQIYGKGEKPKWMI